MAVFIPRETVNDDSVLILAWKAPSGSMVAKEQLICEVETSKAVLEIHAPASGLLEYTAAAGEEVPVGSTICTIGPVEGSGILEAAGPPSAAPPAGLPPARLSAAARAAAIDLGIDSSSFAPGALVTRNDILRQAGKLPPGVPAPVAADAPDVEKVAARGVPIQWEDLPRRKVLEGWTVQRGRALSVQSSVTTVCRAAPLEQRLEELGLSPAGFQAAVVFEASRLLHKYPMFNALHDRGRIGLYSRINVGWALDGGQGLVVPVIPDADRKNLQEIASAMERHIEAYVEGALSPADFVGATFTVTDLSGLGVSFFQPLMVPGQAAILGIGKGPDYQGETILHLTLAFDHQLSEGRKAAEFLQDLRQRLEIHASLAPAADETPEPEEKMEYCVLCHRDSRALRQMKLVLLKSEVPPGLVCSLCVAGW